MLTEIFFKCMYPGCGDVILQEETKEHMESHQQHEILQNMVTDKKMVHGKARSEAEL